MDGAPAGPGRARELWSRHVATSEFARDVLALMAGGAAAQAIGILAAPVLARLFLPADFGVFAVFVAVAAILGEVATLRYDLAVMLPEQDRDALGLAALASWIAVAISALVLAAVLLFGDVIARALGEPALRGWLLLLPASILIAGLYSVLANLAGRRRLFPRIARNRVAQSAIHAGASAGLGVAGAGAGGLIAGNLLGQAAGPLLLAPPTLAAYAGIRRTGMRGLARRYANFPRYDVLNTLVFTVALQGLVLVLARYYGSAAVGFYSFAQKILMALYVLFAGAFAQAFYQKISAAYVADRPQVPRLVVRAMDRIAIAWTVPLALVALLSIAYVPFVFGETWSELYLYVYLLAPQVYLTLVATPLSHVLKTYERQGASLAMNAALAVTRLGSLLLAGALGWSVLDALLLFSVVGTLHVALNTLIVLRLIGARPSHVVLGALFVALAAVAALAAWRAGGPLG